MKTIATYMALLLTSSIAWSQKDTLTNSFESAYRQANPTLNYQHDDVNQIHNYSGNWDFDQDGKTDQLLFIGTGGAHLYYYLRIILSSGNIASDYPFIALDMPLLPGNDELKRTSYNPLKTLTQFAVLDCDGDGVNDIFLHLDDQTATVNSKQLRKHGINSRAILITFKKRKVKLNNYSGR